MIPTTETYFARRIRESQAAMAGASDAGSRLAHAQLEAAYRLLAQQADRLPAEPIYQHRDALASPFGVASVTTADGSA